MATMATGMLRSVVDFHVFIRPDLPEFPGEQAILDVFSAKQNTDPAMTSTPFRNWRNM